MANFTGLPYPLTQDARGYYRSQSGLSQVKSDLLCLLLTNPGERCLTGDTKIPLANGTEATICELVGKEPFWVYSYDANTDSIVPGKATAHKTLTDAELVEVMLDNNEKVRCTPNHLWLLRNGEYRRADELSVGDSLMPLYKNLNTSGYERVYQPYLGDYRETHLCFVSGYRLSGVREVVHHKDLNKLNNTPDNLQWMTGRDHRDLHKQIRSIFDEKMKIDPEFRENWLVKQKAGIKKYYETHGGNRKGVVLSEETRKKLSEAKKKYYETEEGIKQKNELGIWLKEQCEVNGHPMKGKKHTDEAKESMRKPRPSMLGDNNPSKRPDVRKKISDKLKGREVSEEERAKRRHPRKDTSKMKEVANRPEEIERRRKFMIENNPMNSPEVRKKQSESMKRYWANKKRNNHKVISISKLETREDCYDLNVEQYHNFAISAGAFVHNCMLQNYGTNLRSLIYEPNDITLAQTAKQMIIQSIATWEPRITIQQINVSTQIDSSELSSMDNGTEVQHILSIQISFIDPGNISQVDTLVLDVPLGGT